jgi:hypothetical protein
MIRAGLVLPVLLTAIDGAAVVDLAFEETSWLRPAGGTVDERRLQEHAASR